MSTEHDPTTPVPAQPPAAAGDRPTAPVRRAPGPRADDPTVALDLAHGDEGDTRPIPRRLGAEGATRPVPTRTGTTTRPVATGAAATTAPVATGAGATTAPAATSEAGTPPTDPAAPSPEPEPDRRTATPLRVGTVVWGLVLTLLGIGVLAIAGGAQVDLELAAIGLLALAGLALVVGSVITSARRRH